MSKKKTEDSASDAEKRIRVTALRDGFRRAGRAWSGETELAEGDLTEAQLAAVKAEPMLIVEEI